MRASNWLRRCLPVLGILASVAGVADAKDTVPDRVALDARVAAIRSALLAADRQKSGAADLETIAQWFNWPNWANWGNWGNWPNWPNR